MGWGPAWDLPIARPMHRAEGDLTLASISQGSGDDELEWLRGGGGRRWSPRQSVFYQGPFIRREKGRRKSTEDTALAAQSIGRVAPANKLSDKDRNGFPRQRRRQGRCVPKTHRKVEGLQAGETGSRGRWIFLSREYILYVVVTEQ